MNTDLERKDQRTGGLRAVLSLAPMYRFAQSAIGAEQFRETLAQEYIRAQRGDRVVDFGCGTADILDNLPDIDYVGFDPSDRYITDARSRFGDRARFVTDVDQVHSERPDRTIALAIGVLHHIDDTRAEALIALAAANLEPTGRMVSIDPTIVEGQHRVARFLAKQDRGQHVRDPQAIRRLFGAFGEVTVTVRNDLLRVPYSHVVVEASQPRPSR